MSSNPDLAEPSARLCPRTARSAPQWSLTVLVFLSIVCGLTSLLSRPEPRGSLRIRAEEGRPG